MGHERTGGGGRIHLPALTGLRILAALAVYFSHIPTPPAQAPEAFRTFIGSGYMGVTLFFVLSGFVLAITYRDRLARPTFTGVYEFFVARFARVYPLYLLVLLYVIVRLRSYGSPIDDWWQHVLTIQAWNPDIAVMSAFNPPGWSIGVEFFLYACFPLMIPLLGRLRRPRTLLIVGGAIALVMIAVTAWFVASGRGDLGFANPDSAHRWLYRTPLLRLGDFALGILAALLYMQVRGRPAWSRWGAPIAIVAGVATIVMMAWPAHLITAWSFDVSYALPAVVLVFGLAIAPASRPSRVLSLPFVVLLGEASYAFYLVHFPALNLLGAGRWSVETSPTNLAFEAFTLGAVLALAVGVHILVERPSRDWIRKLLIRRRRGARQPTPLPVEEPMMLPRTTPASAATTTNS